LRHQRCESKPMSKIGWSLKYDKCTDCGTTDMPHIGHGLCRHCYHRQRYIKLSANRERTDKGDIIRQITREYLIREYKEKGKSLQDIANDVKCTRQYMHSLMKSFGVKRRSRSEARSLALSAGKLGKRTA